MTFELRHITHATYPPPVDVVEVHGEIDTPSAADFEAAISSAAVSGWVILDLSPVIYLSSAAFAALDRLIQRGIAVVIAADSPLRRAADLVGLPFHGTVIEAISAPDSPPQP